VVPEFRDVRVVELPADVANQLSVRCVPDPLLADLPTGAKLLRLGARGVNGSTEASFGLPWSPEEFTANAMSATHPFLLNAALPDCLIETLFWMFTRSPAQVAKERVDRLKFWLGVKKELEHESEKFNAGLHESVAKVLQGKHLVLMKRMLQDTSYPDTGLVDDIASGFEITGMPRRSHVFRSGKTLPALSEEQLRAAAKWTRHAVIGSISTSGTVDPELDEAIWQETCEEIQRGWLVPTTAAELDQEFGKDAWAPARRFGVRQGGKCRAIDDFSLPMTNAAYGSHEKLDLMNVDEVASLGKLMAEIVSSKDQTICLRTSKGVLRGVRHPAWRANGQVRLTGRTLDLWKAYRQLATSPKSARWCLVAVLQPEMQEVRLFKQPVLAFGATASVQAFNRLSRALWWLGVKEFGLPWSVFYDDFPHMEVEFMGASGLSTSEAFLHLLGWKVTTDERKHLPFSESFQALGVVLDFRNIWEGNLVVRNKEGRIDEIIQSVQSIIKQGTITMSELARLRGRLQFAESYLMGRMSRFLLAPLADGISGTGRGRFLLCEELCHDLHDLCRFILAARPRVVRMNCQPRTIVCFTDGACSDDDQLISCGAVVHDESSWWFGMEVPGSLSSYWKEVGQKTHLVSEAELLPWLLVRAMLRSRDDCCLVLLFIDNDSVATSIVRGSCRVASMKSMMMVLAKIEFESPVGLWTSRVPSLSNPADAPSRLHHIFADDCHRGDDRSAEAQEVLTSLLPELIRTSRSKPSSRLASS
jgi:hypothetical protein